jgi:hypothetical protein
MLNFKGIKLYYLMVGTNQIHSNVCVRTEQNGKIVRFKDGGWNPAHECFLTKKQCRDFHNLKNPLKNQKIDGLVKTVKIYLDKILEENDYIVTK